MLVYLYFQIVTTKCYHHHHHHHYHHLVFIKLTETYKENNGQMNIEHKQLTKNNNRVEQKYRCLSRGTTSLTQADNELIKKCHEVQGPKTRRRLLTFAALPLHLPHINIPFPRATILRPCSSTAAAPEP